MSFLKMKHVQTAAHFQGDDCVLQKNSFSLHESRRMLSGTCMAYAIVSNVFPDSWTSIYL